MNEISYHGSRLDQPAFKTPMYRLTQQKLARVCVKSVLSHTFIYYSTFYKFGERFRTIEI